MRKGRKLSIQAKTDTKLATTKTTELSQSKDSLTAEDQKTIQALNAMRGPSNSAGVEIIDATANSVWTDSPVSSEDESDDSALAIREKEVEAVSGHTFEEDADSDHTLSEDDD